MEQVELKAEVRTEFGSRISRRLRREGKLPAILYGHNFKQVALVVDGRTMEHLFGNEGFHGIINLKVEGDAKGAVAKGPLMVLIKGHQADPITRQLIHIDFYKVDMKEKVSVAVPIHIEGTAPGVKAGGILESQRRELDIRCLPNAIPEFITVDVGGLEMGDNIHVEDLVLPAGVEAEAETNFAIVSVAAPSKVEEEVPAEEAVVEGEEAAEEKPAEGKAEEKTEEKEKGKE